MRVLYVSKASRVATHRDKLAALSELVDLTLVVPERWGGAPLEEASEPYPVVRLPGVLHGRNHFHLYRAPGRVLSPGAFDLVHVDEEPYSLVTAQVVRLAERLGVPSLFFAWQNLVKRLPPPFGAVRRFVFRRARGGIAGTDEAGDVLRRAGFRGPMAIVPQMGVDPVRFRPDADARAERRASVGIADGRFVVGFLGRLVPEKGVDLLLEALEGVPGADALLVGDGPEGPRLRRRVAAGTLAGRVRFVGEVKSPDVPGWLNAMDCLALPSRTVPGWKEQFGRALVEAMATRLPVVGSASGEIPRVIGDVGRVVPEGDARALGRELGALAADAELRARLGRLGRARVLERYTQERVAADTMAFYRRVLGGRPSRRGALDAAGGRR